MEPSCQDVERVNYFSFCQLSSRQPDEDKGAQDGELTSVEQQSWRLNLCNGKTLRDGFRQGQRGSDVYVKIIMAAAWRTYRIKALVGTVGLEGRSGRAQMREDGSLDPWTMVNEREGEGVQGRSYLGADGSNGKLRATREQGMVMERPWIDESPQRILLGLREESGRQGYRQLWTMSRDFLGKAHALWEGEAGGSRGQEIETIPANMYFGRLRQTDHLAQEFETSLGNMVKLCLYKMKKLAGHSGMRLTFSGAGRGGSYLESQHFGRPRRADHLRSGVQGQPRQHGETPSLLKNTKISWAWWRMPIILATREGSSDSHASVSRVAAITGVHHHAWLIFVFLGEMGFRHVGQASLELLISDFSYREFSFSLERAVLRLGTVAHACNSSFMKLRRVDHLNLRGRDQPGQH
ncbi:hypothetical protein AAY473_002521, partial [Plecturocebus cupreus]